MKPFRIILTIALMAPPPLAGAAEPPLFPDSCNGPAYRFAELYAAEAETGQNGGVTLREKLTRDGVIVEGGDLADIRSIVASEGPLTAPGGAPLTVSVATRLGRHYRVEWCDTLGTPVFALAFPIDHLLLTRQTPASRESRLLDSLRALETPPDTAAHGHRAPHRLPPAAPQGSGGPRPHTLPAVVEGDHLFTPDINNNLYLSPLDSLPLVSPADFPAETLSNIITTAEIPNSLRLDLTYVTLDREKMRLAIPLNPLLRHFRDQGCDLFFGLTEVRPDGRHTCLLMARNAPEGYCHSMRLRLDSETVGTLSGVVEARLTAYIPLSRILSLFDENNQ